MSGGRKNPSVAGAFEPSADAALRSLTACFRIVEKRCFCKVYAIRICDRDWTGSFDPAPLAATEEHPVLYDGHFAMEWRKEALGRSRTRGAPLAVGRTPRDGSPGNNSHDELDIGDAR